ncbi:hypothetical protein LEP1GSC061_1065 [Leptospira wolffii serovar Khorat str. Khorat-H2]|nr:hypothetical protein LEP1GSC061_1065 [Leptospira wolffii serovar Khorat str. Khorat-H2]
MIPFRLGAGTGKFQHRRVPLAVEFAGHYRTGRESTSEKKIL